MKTTKIKEALKSEIRRILKEEMDTPEQKWIVYFTTPAYPDPEDAEGWISVGKDQDEAKENLIKFFNSSGRQTTKFYRVQVSPVEGDKYYAKYQDEPKFTQIQEILKEETDNSEQKWVIYFTTMSYPDLEDAEGWISVGANKDEAVDNLEKFFDKTRPGVRKYWLRQVKPMDGEDKYYLKYKDEPKFTQIQETLSEMARIAKTLKIADKDAAQQVIEKFKGTKKAWIADMITKVIESGDEGIAQVALAKAIGKVDEFGDGRQQAINPEVRSLLGAGVFTFGEAGTKTEPIDKPEVNEPVSNTITPEPEEEEIPEPDDDEDVDIKDDYEKPEEEEDDDEEILIKKTGPSKVLSTKATDLDIVIKDMKKLASDYRKAQTNGDKEQSSILVNQLKEKTKLKNQLEREIAKAIGDDEDEDI